MNGREQVGTIRVVVADDERLARQKLRLLLNSEKGMHVVAECSDGMQTVSAVRSHKPDLLFLDVRMPHLDGFQVLERIPSEAMPMVIFTTAFDQYAIKAFEADALDYLLKPFDHKRLHRAVEKAQTELHKSNDHAAAGRLLMDLLARTKGTTPLKGRLMIKVSGRLVFLDMDEVDWIEAAANYVRFNVGKDCYLLRESISRIAARLDPGRFARIHRSIVVNIDRIRELQPCGDGEYIAVLMNGKSLSCSRGYRDEIRRLIDRNS